MEEINMDINTDHGNCQEEEKKKPKPKSINQSISGNYKEFQRSVRKDKTSTTAIFVKVSQKGKETENQRKSSKRPLNSEGATSLELVC